MSRFEILIEVGDDLIISHTENSAFQDTFQILYLVCCDLNAVDIALGKDTLKGLEEVIGCLSTEKGAINNGKAKCLQGIEEPWASQSRVLPFFHTRKREQPSSPCLIVFLIRVVGDSIAFVLEM